MPVSPFQGSAVDLLLSFIGCSDIARTQVREVLKLVELALDDCAEDDERFPYLVAIEEQLLQGAMPHSRLSNFSEKFAPRQIMAPCDLESEFRKIAGELPETVWCTSTYLELEAALDSFDEDGDELQLRDYLEFRQEAIQQVLERYANETILSEEVTSESVVGHRLLTEGLAGWLEALELAQVSLQQGEASWQSPLEAAERGNRLLLATQKLHLRVASQVTVGTKTEGAVL